jgi:hypothetical protein
MRGGTPQGCQNCYFSDRYRFAQPPANCFSVFGAHRRFDRGNTDPDTTYHFRLMRSTRSLGQFDLLFSSSLLRSLTPRW